MVAIPTLWTGTDAQLVVLAKVVCNTLGTGSCTPGRGFTQFRDLAGATTPVAAGSSVTIGPKPILIEKPAAGTLPRP